MNRRLLLTLSFIICAGSVFGLLTRKEQSSDIPVIHVADEATQQTVRIWTAQHDFTEGDSIPLSALESTTTYAPQTDAGTSQTVEQGMLAATAIPKGAVITESMLLRPGQKAYREFLLQPDKVPFPIKGERRNKLHRRSVTW